MHLIAFAKLVDFDTRPCARVRAQGLDRPPPDYRRPWVAAEERNAAVRGERLEAELAGAKVCGPLRAGRGGAVTPLSQSADSPIRPCCT
jgi:hypothetical protein